MSSFLFSLLLLSVFLNWKILLRCRERICNPLEIDFFCKGPFGMFSKLTDRPYNWFIQQLKLYQSFWFVLELQHLHATWTISHCWSNHKLYCILWIVFSGWCAIISAHSILCNQILNFSFIWPEHLLPRVWYVSYVTRGNSKIGFL